MLSRGGCGRTSTQESSSELRPLHPARRPPTSQIRTPVAVTFVAKRLCRTPAQCSVTGVGMGP